MSSQLQTYCVILCSCRWAVRRWHERHLAAAQQQEHRQRWQQWSATVQWEVHMSEVEHGTYSIKHYGEAKSQSVISYQQHQQCKHLEGVHHQSRMCVHLKHSAPASLTQGLCTCRCDQARVHNPMSLSFTVKSPLGPPQAPAEPLLPLPHMLDEHGSSLLPLLESVAPPSSPRLLATPPSSLHTAPCSCCWCCGCRCSSCCC
jgi:hypothetical protein